MIRLVFLLMCLPGLAAADWMPRPSMFSYAASFDLCTASPDTPDLARACEKTLTSAYTLKRAVAWAAFRCHPEDLSTCAAPFEDEGLPAIAARIAVDIGCDATDVTLLDEGAQIAPDHCVTIASDIMIDEGVVPLLTEISCGIDWVECGEIAQINAAFWARQVTTVAANDPELAADLQARNRADCVAQARAAGGWATELNALICEADRSAALWADLVTQD